MKVITLCADCAYYSMKKHKCTRGAKDEGEPTARFYADCPLDDVVQVVHGRWKSGIKTITKEFCCSECSGLVILPVHAATCYYNYCPNCGAKMDGDGA